MFIHSCKIAIHTRVDTHIYVQYTQFWFAAELRNPNKGTEPNQCVLQIKLNQGHFLNLSSNLQFNYLSFVNAVRVNHRFLQPI